MSTLFSIEPEIDNIPVRVQEITTIFEDNFPRNATYREHLEEVFQLYLYTDLFLDLDEYQFKELRKQLSLLNKSTLYLNFRTTKEADYFYKNLIIFCKFPHYARIDFNKSLPLFCENGYYKAQTHVAELFFKYPISNDFLHQFEIFDLKEIHILLQISNGVNIRTIQSLDIQLSKKESYYFHLENGLLFSCLNNGKQYMRKRAIASILAKNCPEKIHFIDQFLMSVDNFQKDSISFFKNIDYWIKVLKVIPSQLDDHQRNNFIHFIEHHYDNDTRVSMNKRSFQSLHREMLRWHQELGKISAHKEQFFWKQEKINILKKIYHEQRTYEYKELTNSYDLYLDGVEKNHCVSIYDRQCERGDSEIWILTDIKQEYDQGLTIEIKNRKIVQVAGKHNRIARAEELAILKIFALKEDYQMYTPNDESENI